MARSQNGWTVIDQEDCDQGPFQGVRFPNGIRAGDVATIMRWQLDRYRETVEPIVAGTCWGYNRKKIEGSDDWSNHASGTAWDINAPQHPMGPPTRTNMSQREIDACHKIEAASEGTLRWGGDFGRPDPMHWEIIGTPAQCARFAKRIREAEVDAKDIEAIAQRTAALLKPQLDAAASAWDDAFGRGENRVSAGEVLVETRDNTRQLLGVLAPSGENPGGQVPPPAGDAGGRS